MFLDFSSVPGSNSQEHFVLSVKIKKKINYSQVRDSVGLSSRMVALAVKGQIKPASPNFWTKFLFRSTADSIPTVEIIKNPMLDEFYHGYLKYKKKKC